MEKTQDFSHLRHFPGTAGNRFDLLLHKFIELQKIHWLVFGALLLGWSALINGGNITLTAALWGFFIGDWLLLEALPKMRKSFGPAKPVVTILAAARSLALLLPVYVWLPLQFLGTALVIYGFWIEPHRIKITRQQLSTHKLPPGTKFTLLHLGDLHVERVTNRERELNRLINSIKPDLILFSGDFLNLSYIREPHARNEARSIIQEWKAPLGVYTVTGSPAVDLEEIVPILLDGTELRWLRDECVTIPVGDSQINLVGMGCSHKPFIDLPRLQHILPAPPQNFTILLYHTPDLAPHAAQIGIDLQLSGHTHGGQVRLPFYGALFAGSLYGKRYEAGKYSVDNMTLYTSRGIGMEGAGAPRVRFLCPPEIILWEITGK